MIIITTHHLMAAEIQISNDDQKIHRVPPLILNEEKNHNDYFPKVVSIGPFHHGKPELAFVEAFKPTAVSLLVGETEQNKEIYLNNVAEIIEEIKKCYEEESIAKYSSAQLAQMMLHDASLIIVYMVTTAPANTLHRPYGSTMKERLGMLTVAILPRDLFLLENQIPLFVIKRLINLRYGEGEAEELLYRYMNKILFGEDPQKGMLQKGVNRADEPLHLLEAFHRLIVSDCFEIAKTSCRCYKCRWLCRSTLKRKTSSDLEIGVHSAIPNGNNRHSLILGGLGEFLSCKNNPIIYTNNRFHSFRTVTDLKAKGIHFKPSPTKSLRDVEFKSHFFYARLRLPWWAVSTYTKVFFKNMVAYELSPKSPAFGEVTSYINLMKSLIDRPGDVKELRERRILCNTLSSDEEAANVYNTIDTYGADNPKIFGRVKEQIQVHYNSKGNIWMAEILHNSFRSPWTATAFFAAAALLAISAAQLYYAMHPTGI